MTNNRSIHRIMGTLLVADVGLLVLSGIPPFKHADAGWKSAVGAGAWLAFIGVSISLIGLAVATLVRRRRRSGDRGAVQAVTTRTVDKGRRTALWGAAALIAAMVADLVETVIDPASSGEAAGVFHAAVQHHTLMVLCGYLLLASAIFVSPGRASADQGHPRARQSAPDDRCGPRLDGGARPHRACDRVPRLGVDAG